MHEPSYNIAFKDQKLMLSWSVWHTFALCHGMTMLINKKSHRKKFFLCWFDRNCYLECKNLLDVHIFSVSAVHLFFLILNRDGTAKLWNCGQAKCIATLLSAESVINCCAISDVSGLINLPAPAEVPGIHCILMSE